MVTPHVQNSFSNVTNPHVRKAKQHGYCTDVFLKEDQVSLKGSLRLSHVQHAADFECRR